MKPPTDFLYCANEASYYWWDNTDYEDCVTSNAKARDALYDRLREETDLTANLVQEAIRRAVHAVDSGVDRCKRGERTNKPEFTSWSMVYDKRSATFYRNKISLSTVNGRVEVGFELSVGSPTPYEEYVLSDEYEFRASTLQYDQATDEFYVHVTAVQRGSPRLEPWEDARTTDLRSRNTVTQSHRPRSGR